MMIQTFAPTITKDDINLMPIEKFEGRIISINTEKDADKACKYLAQYKIIGFDTETRPNFRKDQHNLISLMQISTDDTCFLFRLNYIGMPHSLVSFLTSSTTMMPSAKLKTM